MTDTPTQIGWCCYWKMKYAKTQVDELVEIIKSLEGGEDKLSIWVEEQRIKDEEREEKRLKREFKKLGIKR